MIFHWTTCKLLKIFSILLAYLVECIGDICILFQILGFYLDRIKMPFWPLFLQVLRFMNISGYQRLENFGFIFYIPWGCLHQLVLPIKLKLKIVCKLEILDRIHPFLFATLLAFVLSFSLFSCFSHFCTSFIFYYFLVFVRKPPHLVLFSLHQYHSFLF